eukprot:TRINITY_DN30515_c0_g1_i6.p1 TRINITY_DN30515_c0_g1~~TRINITY_DN30515_c0_g1_i6.p1  ORF type:complete len:351 (+),score=44.93 TRINITY_DN30515_c0_g1_i6:218-1270(+)
MSDHRLPKISVVIPCFNYERYVASAIESALGQDYPNKEIIVVNDGSTDGSAQIIGRFDQRITRIDQQNQGHIASCNRGYTESSGDVVLFLDADDLLEPTALSHVAGAWSPRCAKVQFDLKIIDADGVDTGRRFCNFAAGYGTAQAARAFERTATYRWPVTTGNAYSRFFLDQMFPLQIKEAPDGHLNTVAPLYGEVAVVAKVLGAYRVHGANIWASTGSDSSRLPHRIHTRQREVALLKELAHRMGKSLPAGNVLDHELPMLNYRLMALKLQLPYQQQEVDSAFALACQGCRLALTEPLTLKHRIGHVGWFSLLSLMPKRGVPYLIRLRFNRSELLQSLRRSVGLAPMRP